MGIFGPTGAGAPLWPQQSNDSNLVQQMQQDLKNYLKDPSTANFDQVVKDLKALESNPAYQANAAQLLDYVNEIETYTLNAISSEQEAQNLTQKIEDNPNSPNVFEWREERHNLINQIRQDLWAMSQLGSQAEGIANQMGQ